MTRYLLALAALAGCYRDSAPTPAPEPEARAEPPAPKRRPRKPPPPPGKPALCDEVSCVLDNYSGPCCDKFRKHPRPASSPGIGAGGPAPALDRGAIASAIAAVRPQLQACANQASAKGTVKVTVRVAPDGSIEKLDVTAGIDPAIDSCVAAAVSQATFPVTQSGGSFSYPFVF